MATNPSSNSEPEHNQSPLVASGSEETEVIGEPVTPPDPERVAKGRVRFDALRTLFASPKARIGFAIVLFFILVAVFAPAMRRCGCFPGATR